MIRSLRATRARRQAQRDKAVWERAACWYRVRYEDGDTLQRVLTYLSTAVGPVALRRRQAGALTMLFVGMAADRAASLESRQTQGFRLQAVPSVPERDTAQLYAPAACLSSADCDAWVIGRGLFVAGDAEGVPLPQPHNSAELPAWQLGTPPLGMALDPVWPGNPPLPAAEPDGFVVGYDGGSGQPLRVQRCHIVGDGKRMGPWLAHFVAANPGMDVIDCSGQVAPQLVSSYDHFTVSLHRPETLGFNPLAPLASPEATAARNTWWWQGMHLPPPCLAWIQQHTALASMSQTFAAARQSGIVGQLLQTVLETQFSADTLRLLHNETVPWHNPERVLAYLPGQTAGVRHVARALAAGLLLSGRSVLLIRPPFTGSDWRFLQPYRLAAVTGSALQIESTVALQARADQLESLGTIIPVTACEHLPGLGSQAALIAQETALWRVFWCTEEGNPAC